MVPKEDGGTLRSAIKLYGKPYVFIDDVFADFLASGEEVCIITNSDIQLQDPTALMGGYIEKARTSLVIANRQDHNGDYQGKTYPHGFDVFILPRSFIETLPPTLFCFGQTWWDYWLPYRAIKQGVPLTLVKEPLFWHHRHAQQHDEKQWHRMTQHFTWVEGVMQGQKPYTVTGQVYNMIRKACR